MSWEDKPTDNQLNAIFNFIEWHAHVPRKKAKAAIDYLREHATRRQASDELGRLRNLYIDRKLNRDNCLTTEVWKDFEFDGDDIPSDEQNALIYAIFRRHMPIGRAALASSWLGQNATRKEVAEEIDRVKALEKRHALSEEECFISDVWKKYKPMKANIT